VQTFSGEKAIHALTWSAARPAAKRVRPLAALAAVVVAAAAAALGVMLDDVVVLALATTVGGWLTWRVARRLLAAYAVRGLRDKTPLRAVTVARLVARGTAVERGTHYLAVQDAHRVVVTTTTAGPGQQIALAAVTNLGNSGT
jgi:hypothetical protein